MSGDSGDTRARCRPVAVFYFVRFCHLATFFRYLTLYFQSDGLRAADIGTLWSVHRLLFNGLTPFWGAMADKTKRARSMLQASLLISPLPFLALAVPASADARFFARAAALWAFGITTGPWGGIQDALARAACDQDAEVWGRARVWGAVGWAASHLVLGPLMDELGAVVIFVTNLATTVCLYLITRSTMPESCGKVKADVTLRAVLGIFRRNWLFFVNVMMVGGGFSMVEGMLFLLLQEMRASTMLCGLSVVVTVLFELPIFHYAKEILARLGAKKMLLVGQAAWVVRALFYSRMSNPWSVLLIEPLHGVTFALVWTAALHHVSQPSVAGLGLEASANGLLSFCFMGLGQALGLSLGGFIFDNVGSHAVYAIFAAVIGSSGLVYAVLDPGEAESPGHGQPKADGGRAGPRPLPLGRADVEESPFEQPTPKADQELVAASPSSLAESPSGAFGPQGPSGGLEGGTAGQ